MTAPSRLVPAGRCEIGSGGTLLDDGHVLQGPLLGGLDARPRLPARLPWGRVIEGVSSLQCCNSLRVPPPTGDGTEPAGAGRAVRDRIRERAAGRWPCPPGAAAGWPRCAAITWSGGLSAAAVAGGLALKRKR